MQTDCAEQDAQHSHAIKANLHVHIGQVDFLPFICVGSGHVHGMVDPPGAAQHQCLIVRPNALSFPCVRMDTCLV